MDDTREVIRCSCGLNQYLTLSGLCRKPDCRKPLKPTVDLITPSGVVSGEHKPVEERYAATKSHTYNGTLRYSPMKEKEFLPENPHSVPAPFINVDSVLREIESNVRPRKKYVRHQKTSTMVVQGVPNEFRLRLLAYCKENKITLRDLVVNALKKEIDRKE